MQVRGRDLSVCSWSVQPRNMADLIGKVRELGLDHVHLGLSSVLDLDLASRASEIALLRESRLKLTAGSIVFPGEDYSSIPVIRTTGGFTPDEQWPARRERAIAAAALAAEIGIDKLAMHIGFVTSSSDPSYTVLVERVRDVSAALGAAGIEMLIETGQQTGSELLQFLNDLNSRNVAVNFDPANMILYGTSDPIPAIQILDRHIHHVHIKDAVGSKQPRMEWGKEVPFGSGQVDALALLDALDEIAYTGPLAIERDSGNERIADIRSAIDILRSAEEPQEVRA